MFLALLKVYLPEKIVDFIFANSIFNFNLGFIGIGSVPILKDLLDMFRIDHSDETLHELSVDSLSTFYNLFFHLLVLLLIVILHLIFWLIKSRWPDRKSDSCCVRLVYWTANQLWTLLTFTLYIRTILQISQFWILSSVSELHEANLNSRAMEFSFAIACISLWGIIAFSTLNATLSFKNYDHSVGPFKEYFNGIKNTKLARMYNVVLVTRRVVLVTLMICLNHINKVHLVLAAVLYQVTHTGLIILVRPHTSVKDNINEIMIDLVFWVLLTILLHFYTEDRWNEVATSAYFYLLQFPGLFIFLTFISKYCKRVMSNLIIVQLVVISWKALKSRFNKREKKYRVSRTL